MKPTASIVITTRNRRDDTLLAVASAFAQDCAVEVLVYDDASDDETAKVVKRDFPHARVYRNVERSGYIVNRNRGFRDALAPVVFSLDDDAYFSAPDTVSRTLKIMADDGKIAAVAIPFIEPLSRRSLSSQRAGPPPAPFAQLRSYVGCAHAVRTEAALGVGGYREFFIHQREEPDLCLRMLNAGWRIVYGDSAPIVHMVSPKRDAHRVSHYGARNSVLCDTLNVPFPDLLARLVRTPIGVMCYRFSWSDAPNRIRALASGWLETIRRLNERRPVSHLTYRTFVKLPSHGSLQWEGDIPAPCGAPLDAAPLAASNVT